MSWGGWIGVDLDGTLAHYEPGHGIDTIGPPIPAMVDRVLGWLNAGKEVRIFTARVAASELRNDDGVEDGVSFAEQQRGLVESWCEVHLGRVLPVTATKDFRMIALYDDRCVQMEPNTGRALGPEPPL